MQGILLGQGGSEANMNYSTEEQMTKDKWINGKPIYQKTIVNPKGTGGTVVVCAEIETLIDFQYIAKPNASYAYYYPCTNSDQQFYFNGNSKGIYNYNAIEYIATLRYTKTTD